MTNTTLLTKILKTTNKLITSEEYKLAYSIGNSFSRNRKLSFSNVIYFICSGLRNSISSEIANFIENNSNLNFPNISKQAFSKARQNISYEAFKELCRLFVTIFYESNKNLNKWNGYNILAVDGTTLQVPDTSENVEIFGARKNQYTTETALACASALYDVMNDIVIDAKITSYPGDERLLARQHIETINQPQLLDKTIVIFDRGYPSYDMFTFLDQKGLFFLMRVSSAFKLANATSVNDSKITYKSNGVSKDLRVIKIELSDGSIETLITNIFDTTITPLLFNELYFLRWGIECKYKELKCSIEIEEFSGNKQITIHQDFYASIHISMVTSIIKKESDAAIAVELAGKNLKSSYHANKNFIINQVLKKIISIMTRPRLAKQIIDKILEKSIKIRSQIRPNRSCERKNKHPRKKHHNNIKSCI